MKRSSCIVAGVITTLVIVSGIFTFFILASQHGDDDDDTGGGGNSGYKTQCESLIYCKGDLLSGVQMTQVFDDQKTFVDMNIRSNVSIGDILGEWNEITNYGKINATRKLATLFVSKNFEQPSEALLDAPLAADFVKHPPALARLNNSDLRDFAYEIHSLWPNLTKITAEGSCTRLEDAFKNNIRSSLLCLPKPFVIAAGRFRELYYWDEYFISLGLLASGLRTQVEHTIQNFGALIDAFGKVPNGNRAYYLSRSQPPMFTHLLNLYYEAYTDEAARGFVAQFVPLAEKEWFYWRENRWCGYFGCNYMNQFGSTQLYPRPESYLEDMQLAADLDESKDYNERVQLFRNVGAAAESGQDFSSRWFANVTSMRTIRTRDLVPVDLNALMYSNERILATLCKVGECERRDFETRASKRKEQMLNNLRYENEWSDALISYDKEGCNTGGNGYCISANGTVRVFDGVRVRYAAPLVFAAWSGVNENITDDHTLDVLNATLLRSYGLATSTVSAAESGQQWDGNNAWPPFQFLYWQSLIQAEREEQASTFAFRWLQSAYCGWSLGTRNGLFEKMNATAPCGQSGHGGEYTPQVGFGWSNGVGAFSVARTVLFVFTFSRHVNACF